MATVSLVIITRNEAANIRRCLQSLRWADEIVVVDAESADATVEVAGEFTDKVFVRRWDGFTPQRNFALAQATGDWVFVVDADEVVTPALAAEVRRVTAESPLPSAFTVPRRTWFCGKFLRWGGNYPDRVLRLFRRGTAAYSERLLHEAAQTDAPVGRLQNDLLHYSHPTLDVYFDKFDRVSHLGALQMQREGKRWRASHLLFNPLAKFISCFILQKGYRDGWHGFVYAALGAMQVFTKYARLWELEQRGDPAWEEQVARRVETPSAQGGG